MKRHKTKGIKLYIYILMIFILGIYFKDPIVEYTGKAINSFSQRENGLKIANWNLQIFGQAKSSNPELMEFYKDKIEKYDVLFLQEIRDSSQTAFPKLCEMLENYSCYISTRAGRSSSKEQYGIVYTNRVNLTDVKDFNPDSQDRWERPPIMANFEIGTYKFTIYNLHAKPEDVENELTHLQRAIEKDDAIGNIFVIGDLNADCSYYDEKKSEAFDSWKWIVKDEEDTTVSKTQCAYDRIIINQEAKEEMLDYGIDFEGIESKISDHYIIWISINPSEEN